MFTLLSAYPARPHSEQLSERKLLCAAWNPVPQNGRIAVICREHSAHVRAVHWICKHTVQLETGQQMLIMPLHANSSKYFNQVQPAGTRNAPIAFPKIAHQMHNIILYMPLQNRSGRLAFLCSSIREIPICVVMCCTNVVYCVKCGWGMCLHDGCIHQGTERPSAVANLLFCILYLNTNVRDVFVHCDIFMVLAGNLTKSRMDILRSPSSCGKQSKLWLNSPHCSSPA